MSQQHRLCADNNGNVAGQPLNGLDGRGSVVVILKYTADIELERDLRADTVLDMVAVDGLNLALKPRAKM